MNILFDFITTQAFYGSGGCEYTRKVFYTIQALHSSDVRIIGIYDSSLKRFPYSDLTPDALRQKNIQVIDICGHTLSSIVNEYKIDKIFIGVSQFWSGRYNFDGLSCEIITITHDLFQEEFTNVKLEEYLAVCGGFRGIWEYAIQEFKWAVKYLLGRKRLTIEPLVNALKDNPRWRCITVSEFSKYSFIYHYGIDEKKIRVLYSPERLLESKTQIDDNQLARLVADKVKYYLLVSADRPGKNARKVIAAFQSYLLFLQRKGVPSSELPKLVTIGYRKDNVFDGHINLKPLSESDLVNAYKNSYALVYASFFEGFGYPPMEAMKFAVPVLASNTTSIPEVLGDAPIYFSPFYESDIFKALCALTDDSRSVYSEKSKNQYARVSILQKNALQELIEMVLQ